MRTLYLIPRYRAWEDSLVNSVTWEKIPLLTGDPGLVGFLPVYETREDAERDYPGVEPMAIQVGE